MSHSRRGANESSQNFLNSDGGILDELLNLIRSFCIEWSYAVTSNPGVAQGDEVCELQHKFNLWKNDQQKLDQKLASAPQVRRDVFRILMPCIWELRQGLPFYRPSIQDTLRKDTDRVMEQAANLARYVLPQEEHSSPANLTDFNAACYPSFKSYVTNLNDLSPILDSLFQNPDSLNTQLGQERRYDGGTPSNLFASLSQTIRAICPTKQRNNRISYNMRDLRRDPDSARYRSKHSSDSADSSNISSVFTRNDNLSSEQTDTLTSTSTSSPQEPQRDTDPLTNLTPHQKIVIRNCSSQTDEAHFGLLDSGTSDNFIVRDAVKELNLKIHPLPNRQTYHLLENVKVQVSEYVEPLWRLKKGPTWRQEYRFFVVNDLPDDNSILIGENTLNKMGIQLTVKKSALVAFFTGKNGSSKGRSLQEQPSRAQQSRDDSMYWNQTQKTLEQGHATTRRSTSSGKPPYQALHEEENSTAQVKQKAASQAGR